MQDFIKHKINELKGLCEQHHVKELYLFGSAAKGNFDAQNSDIDLVVNFSENITPENFAENYFSFLEALEKLFNKDIDLLSYRALKNEILIQQVEQTKVPLYAA